MTKKVLVQNHTFKEEALFVRESLKAELGIDIGSSRSHALIAACFGYNSKKAMLDDQKFNPSNPWLHIYFPNFDKIIDIIPRFKNVGLKVKDAEHVSRILHDALTPACSETGNRYDDNLPIGPVGPHQTRNDLKWVDPLWEGFNDKYFLCCCGGETIAYEKSYPDESCPLCEEQPFGQRIEYSDEDIMNMDIAEYFWNHQD